MFERILVLCTGNICRSPVAAALLRQRLPQRQVESAGLGALVDQPVDATALSLAAGCAEDLQSHRARQVSTDMLHSMDLILVMTEAQRRSLASKHPALMGKIMLYGQWLKNLHGAPGLDIPDPYRKSRAAFEQVHKLLVQAADAWQERLGREAS